MMMVDIQNASTVEDFIFVCLFISRRYESAFCGHFLLSLEYFIITNEYTRYMGYLGIVLDIGCDHLR